MGEGYLKTRLKRQKICPKGQAECEGLPSQERHLGVYVRLDAVRGVSMKLQSYTPSLVRSPTGFAFKYLQVYPPAPVKRRGFCFVVFFLRYTGHRDHSSDLQQTRAN